MKVLIIDNYDSFTYNLVHYVEGFDVNVQTCFNTQIPFSDIKSFDKVILSPGPGLPDEAGDLSEFIKKFHNQIPILGVCLGFQALAEFFGGKIFNQNEVKHGVKEYCHFDTESTLFKNLKKSFNVGLYHSWAVSAEGFPSDLKITGKSNNDVIMAFQHLSLPLYGVQFHPESILSENGRKIIHNFLM